MAGRRASSESEWTSEEDSGYVSPPRGHRARGARSRSASSECEWTSEEDCGYVSPPRGHRARCARRKPKRSRIIQDAEEGRMYVILGQNVYPLVRDSPQGMNYLTYHPEDYWKKKYIEVAKQLEVLKKLLIESQTQSQSKQGYDLTEPSTSRNSAPRSPKRNTNHANRKESVDLTIKKPKPEKMVLKFSIKNGVEYCLEGHWEQISLVLPQLVKLAHSYVSNASSKN